MRFPVNACLGTLSTPLLGDRLGLAVPIYATLFVLIDRSFASTPDMGGGDSMAPLFGFLANAGTVVLLPLGAIVLFAAMDGRTHV